MLFDGELSVRVFGNILIKTVRISTHVFNNGHTSHQYGYFCRPTRTRVLQWFIEYVNQIFRRERNAIFNTLRSHKY